MMMLMVMVINIIIVCLISGIHRIVNKVLIFREITQLSVQPIDPILSHLQVSSSPLFWGRLPWKMEIIGRPQTSVINYKSVLHNISEERKPHSKSLSFTIVMRATSESWELVSEKCITFNEFICRCYFISLLTVQPETSNIHQTTY
jgi:hypothetical protein